MKKITDKSAEEIRANCLEVLHENGYCLVENISKHEAYTIIKGIGKLFRQESGEEHLVEYQEGYDDFRYSKSLNEIGPHTEYPYLETPPKFQILYCIQPSACNGGITYTCNVKNFLATLNEEELHTITSIAINFKANKDLKKLKTHGNSFPILSKKPENPFVFRFSHNLIYYGDINANIYSEKEGSYLSEIENPHFAEIVKKLLDYFALYKRAWKIPKNGLLIWNNHQVVHWRGSYQDKTRKLVRYLIE